jgi:hypothetical protein
MTPEQMHLGYCLVNSKHREKSMTPEQRKVIMQEINRIDEKTPEGNHRIQELLGVLNIDEPKQVVKHASLTRASENSPFRSDCPQCKFGILLVNRNQDTFELLPEDRCLLCGQLFEYSDIVDMKRELDGQPEALQSNDYYCKCTGRETPHTGTCAICHKMKLHPWR